MKLSRLGALRAFEAVARQGSFVAAARELNVTAAAVGQQVRSLEVWLGIALFERRPTGERRLIMTAQARAALPALQDGLRQIEAAVDVLRHRPGQQSLTLSTANAFFEAWLLSRIPRFQAAHPEISLSINASDRLVDLVPGEADIAIRYSVEPSGDLGFVELFDETITPVCSPSWLATAGGLRQPADLIDCLLIHEHRKALSSLDFPGWAEWFHAAGVSGYSAQTPGAGSLLIQGSAAVIHAAVAGRGVALGRSVLVEDAVADGRLVRLFPHITVKTPRIWRLVYRQSAAQMPAVSAFRAWLVAETRATRPAGDA